VSPSPYARGARVSPPAKLNWDLRVLGRRGDGYHELRSWFCAVGWRDELEARPLAAGAVSRLEVCGPEAAGAPADAANLVLRAEAAWRAAGGEAPPVAWRLEKHLPSGAGLGGGSADAAGALALLDAMAPSGATRPPLRPLAEELGADVAFLLDAGGAASLRGGRGEREVAAAPRPPAPWVVLAVPDLAADTPAVYAALGADAFSGGPAESSSGDGPADGPVEEGAGNALEAAAFRAAPGLEEFAARLRARHAPFRMTGSGAAFFAPCPHAEAARALRDRVADCCRLVVAAPLLRPPFLRLRPLPSPP